MNSYLILSSLPDASGKFLLRELGLGYMLSPMVAYISRIIMQAISARVIERSECRGGRQASHGRTLTGVERKQFVTHLRTRFQKTVILLSMAELGTRRSAP